MRNFHIVDFPTFDFTIMDRFFFYCPYHIRLSVEACHAIFMHLFMQLNIGNKFTEVYKKTHRMLKIAKRQCYSLARPNDITINRMFSAYSKLF